MEKQDIVDVLNEDADVLSALHRGKGVAVENVPHTSLGSSHLIDLRFERYLTTGERELLERDKNPFFGVVPASETEIVFSEDGDNALLKEILGRVVYGTVDGVQVGGQGNADGFSLPEGWYNHIGLHPR